MSYDGHGVDVRRYTILHQIRRYRKEIRIWILPQGLQPCKEHAICLEKQLHAVDSRQETVDCGSIVTIQGM